MILIGVPYHENKRYALNHVMNWVRDQLYEEVEVVMRVHTGQYGEKNAVKKQFEFFREYALKINADYMYIMEADTIPPLVTITKLVSHNKDIIGALYNYRDSDNNVVAWKHDDPHKNFIHAEEVVEVDGMGTGAVLISNKALKAVSWFDYDQQDADWPYYDKLKEKGFKIYLDPTIKCKHYATAEKYY